MQQIKTHNNIELICIEVPEDAWGFQFISIDYDFSFVLKDYAFLKNSLYYNLDLNAPISEGIMEFVKLEIPVSELKILGKLSELSEEECSRLVEFFQSSRTNKIYYKNYVSSKEKNDNIAFSSYKGDVKDSLISLLQSQGIDTSNLNTLLLIEKM